MINRLIAYVDQIKSVASNKLYFNKGEIFSERQISIFQVKSDFKEDNNKKSDYFKDKIFYIKVNEFQEFIKTYKKNITDVIIENKNLLIKTDVPGVKLEFTWTSYDDNIFNQLIEFYRKLNQNINGSKLIESFKIENSEEISKLLNVDKFYIKDEKILYDYEKGSILIRVIPKKYFGKLNKSTKEFSGQIYEDASYGGNLCKFEILNSKLLSTYYGHSVNLTKTEKEGK